MARHLDDWINAYIEYTEDTEPPLSYRIWTAISTVASTLQRRVYIRWGKATIYPNQYIILIGPSGQTRKTEALGAGKDLIEELQIPIASQQITRQALIKKMKENYMQFMDATSGEVSIHASMTIASEELAVFMGQGDIAFLADLTDWYDSRQSWIYQTKHGGEEKITGVCVNLLGATAPDWLPSILPREAVGGGFTSRTIFVVEEFKGKIIEDPNEVAPPESLRGQLLDDLDQILLISGQMEFENDAKQAYKAWYRKQEESIRAGNPPILDPRFKGYLARRPMHLFKLSMVISASRGDDLFITLADFERSRKLLERTEKRMTSAFRSMGESRFAMAAQEIISFIKSKKATTRSEIMRRFFMDVSAWDMDQIERLMTDMRIIDITTETQTGEVRYALKKGTKWEEEV